MPKDPAFLFYPGDYLRDTQTLSEKSQVAYDRIICEHMRNICISKKQLNFFTKRLNEQELDELMFVLHEVKGGFQIEWVAESIKKRKAYSESRRKNRWGDTKKDMKNICGTYDSHMENENEIEDLDDIAKKNTTILLGESEIWLEDICMKKGYKMPEVKKHLQDFVTDQELKGEMDRPINEIRSHFVNYLRVYLAKTTDKKPKTYQEWLDGLPHNKEKLAKYNEYLQNHESTN